MHQFFLWLCELRSVLGSRPYRQAGTISASYLNLIAAGLTGLEFTQGGATSRGSKGVLMASDLFNPASDNWYLAGFTVLPAMTGRLTQFALLDHLSTGSMNSSRLA